MSVRIIQGDALAELAKLPDASVHCCVTSPPYWGLRDYGIPPSIWGGDPACAHEWGAKLEKRAGGGQPGEKVRWQHTGKGVSGHAPAAAGAFCPCGAWRGALGLEPTPALFVEHIVAVFREARRVLRDDGTLWLNLGDSYTGSGKGGNPDPGSSKQATNAGSQTVGTLYGKIGESARQAAVTNVSRRLCAEQDMAPKNLVGIPWRVAFALQADGWYLRQDIIWAKPNPMPESVRDRCTKAHEYIFLLSKSERYYFDAGTIAEPASDNPVSAARRDRADFSTVGTKAIQGTGFGQSGLDLNAEHKGETRNKRSVWTVATQPFSEAHFATFPPKLIEPCILAGCPTGGTVLDPFGGAGTTGLVADRNGRDAILIELNPDYAAMAEKRIHADGPLFAEVTT